ncbi:reverse transcriptase domain-containing protein [Tanacetum coccineum]
MFIITVQRASKPLCIMLENCLETNDLKWDINWTRSCMDVVALPTSGNARSGYMISGDAKSWVVRIYSLSYSTIVQLIENIGTMTSAGRPATASRGGGTGGLAGSGSGRTRGRSGDQGNSRDNGPGGQVGGQGSEMNDGVNRVPDFSTIIAQQLQNLLPTIVAQVGGQGKGQGNGRNQNGDAVNDNIQGDVSRGCTYKEFLACILKEYGGKGGVIVYIRWIKKMESVHDMSGCKDSQRVKYTAGSFVCKALTWWNSEIHTRGREATVGMSWEDFRNLTREEFCLSNEMQTLEPELWNDAMVRAGHAAYTDRFHELARLIPHLVTPESKRIGRYMYGLALQIQGMVAVTERKTIQKAVQIANTLIDEALMNGTIKKNLEKRGNVGEPSKDRNERDDNKRTRTGNAFATTVNLLGEVTRVQHPSVLHVAITIYLRHPVALVLTVTA